MKRLKPGFKVFLVALVAVGIFFGVKTFMGNSSSDSTPSNKSSNSGGLFGSKTPTYTIGVNTFAGFAPMVWLNGGLKPNDESIIAKEYGIKLNIIIQDDFVAGRNAYKKGDIDMIYCTADSWPIEMGSSSDMLDSRHFFLSNWSRGADAIVVTKGISTVADLKGKKVAVAEGTAAHTLLINTLETNGVSPNDVQLVKVASGMDAAQAFKARQVDAACVWSPDDKDCVEAVSGAKILMSTKQATNIICDGLIAKESFLEKKREDVTKIISALLYANSVMTDNPAEVQNAGVIFAKAFGTDAEFCVDGVSNIRFATLGDNENFYGLNSNYTGIKGDELYSKMARVYSDLKLVSNPVAWRKASDPSIIEELATSGTVRGNQNAESIQTFVVATKEIEKAPEISNKKVSINFATNSYNLDMNARDIIDKEMAPLAKQFGGSRVRIVGNTSATGNNHANTELSFKRADAVVNYLVKEYGFDRNRFMVIGNGPKNALNAGDYSENAEYRVTEFQLVSE